jgi:hypothetical protein
MMRRTPLLVLALAPLLAVVTACHSGSGSTADPQNVRSSLADAYWKVDAAVPSGIDVSTGKGKFVKCSADKPKLAVYRVENLIDAKDGSTTAAQLLAQFRSALGPEGWKLTLDKVQPDTPPTSGVSKTTGYVANKNGMQLQLLLQERTSDVPAGGFMDLYSKCVDLGKKQKDLLARYAPGDSSDVYQPTSSDPHPVPTGYPTTP